MSQILRTLTDLGRNAVKAASEKVSDIIPDVSKFIDDLGSVINIEKELEKLNQKFEPVSVKIGCLPKSADIDDYYLQIDLEAFEAALRANRFVRPVIMVYAASTGLDRDILRERLVEELGLGIQQMRDRIRKLEIKRDVKKAVETVDGVMNTFDALSALLFLVAIGAGAVIGPFLFLLIGLGGLAMLREVPGLIVTYLKQFVGVKNFSTPEDAAIHKLREDIARYKPVLKKMVDTLAIIKDDSLMRRLEGFTK